jgi:outer membrane receptor for ferrienterochelin and colicins
MKLIPIKPFVFLTIFFTSLIHSQQTINGIVVDENNNPLIGASVLIRGTNQGAQTNFDGHFTLEVRESFPKTLQISYVGYNTETIQVDSSDMITILLIAGGRFDEVIVSASRRAEKLQEAPAAVSVVTAEQVSLSGGSLSPLRALTNSPGVELQQQTGQRINIALRGASGIFSTSVFPMLDYRSLITPGLEYFDSQNSPLHTIDIERVEVVLGPGSALYGPDVTSGVVHFISKNPFKYPGTTVELAYGERDIVKVGLRHAGYNEKETFGYKINFKYNSGKDFTLDPNDTDDQKILGNFKTNIGKATFNPEGNIDTSTPGEVLFKTTQTQDSEFWSGLLNTSLYFRPQSGMEIVASGGWNAGNAIFYNDLGEGQVFGNEYWAQARLNYNGWFVQSYYITNDGGSDENPSYLNRTGLIVPLERSHLENQVQYNFTLERFFESEWTTGIDYRAATANTQNYVYGKNEEDDDYIIFGGYLQGKLKLDPKLDLYLAGRYDGYNFVDKKTFAPRAAFVFKPNDKHNIRLTYNRTANPIPASDIYFDLPVQSYGPFDVWVLGAKNGYNFEANPHINWLIPGVPNTLQQDGFPLAAAYQAVTPGVLEGLSALAQDPQLAPLLPIIQGVLTNPATTPLTYTPVYSSDIEGQPLESSSTNSSLIPFLTSYELGYKGSFNNKLSFGFDVFLYKRKGGLSFQQVTPVVTIQGLSENLGQSVRANAQPAIEQALLAAGQPQVVAAATAEQLGVQIEEAYYSAGDAFLQELASAGLPFHGIVPLENNLDQDTPRMTLGYFTQDPDMISTDLGAEAHFKYFMSENVMVQGNYTWFQRDEGDPGDLSFPEHKVRIGFYYSPETAFSAALNYQWDEAYTSNNPNYPGFIPAKNLIDLNLGYRLKDNLDFGISATNLLNHEFRALPGFPKIGRTVIGRIVYELN